MIATPNLPPMQMNAQVLLRHEQPTVELHVPLMGTDIHLLAMTEQPAQAEAALLAAADEMRRIVALMSEWDEASQVSAINRNAGIAPTQVDRELLDLLATSQRMHRLTHGAFDISFSAVGRLWDFKAEDPRAPEPGAVLNRLPLVNAGAMVLDHQACTAYLPKPGMRIGLGGIAKGYAVDRAAAVMQAAGLRRFVVNAGGDLTCRGTRSGRLWWVGIRHPRKRGATIGMIPVANKTVVTSGDYERYFIRDGTFYSHILDPRTGWPARGCMSVTIVANDTTIADALATGVFVLGPKRGMELIESLDDVEAMIVDSQAKVHVSSGLRRQQQVA